MELQYLGEHLLPGIFGNIFVIVAFTAGLLATMSYFFAAKEGAETSWRTIGRAAFRLQSLAIFGMAITLFIMLANQYFEYHYVWKYSSSEMPLRYILSSFWGGQEGSFLLWLVWHAVLGNILIYTSKTWEAPVMTVFSSVQAFLASMLLGLHIMEIQIGSNPFTMLLRDHPDFMNLPLFQNLHYAEHLDGRGLNPLLQNYWMTIHPPTLFLGFASTLIPFTYALSGLWKKQYTEWMRPALPWAFFGIMILGTGILMGGAWAYEALSFGGFWAWDPVENASLVPWLTFVGAAHLMLIHKNKGSSLGGAIFLTLITFILILYSTFLTRSGILGETSVHSFTDLGMSGQLLLYLLSYLIFGVGLLIVRAKHFPKNKTEESIWSREFWMFIGALILLLSAFQISFSTSIPVINAVFGSNLAPPAEVIDHYNSWQLPFAIMLGFVIGFGQFLKYKKTDFGKLIKKLIVALSLAAVFSIIITLSLEMDNPFYIGLLFSSLFAILGNLQYLLSILKGNIKKGGASIAHIGFGMILLGALISTGSSDTISRNSSSFDVTQLGEGYSNNENILLMRDDTLAMGDYLVTYKGKRKEGVNIYYEIAYLQNEDGTIKNAFTLYPLVQLNPIMGNVAEPDTKHFLGKDIYTHVTYAEVEERDPNDNDQYEEPKKHTVSVGDTIYSNNSILVLDSIKTIAPQGVEGLQAGDIAVAAHFRMFDFDTKIHAFAPMYVLRDTTYSFSVPATNDQVGIKATFDRIDPQTNEFDFSVYEAKNNSREFIVMKAIVFPFINILWLGALLLIVGTVLAIVHRVKGSLRP